MVCSICAVGLSSHILLSVMCPGVYGCFTIIISPLSSTFNFHRLACLYTSALFVYSVADSEMLHFSGPRFFLRAVYSSLRADFDAHSMTIRWSNLGAVTRMQPVSSAKSSVSCFDKSSFHSSMLPTKRLVCVRWFTWLYIYSQFDLSLVSCVGIFLWVTVSHLSTAFVFSSCV
jgi:hypothetical protein